MMLVTTEKPEFLTIKPYVPATLTGLISMINLAFTFEIVH